MAEQSGRWVTVNGAHVFIKDGEAPSFNGKLQKTVNHEKTDFREKAREKVKATRDFIEKTVAEINEQNDKPYDPADTSVKLTDTDLQGMVEAFGKEYGFSSRDENDVLDEIRTRVGWSGTDEDREFYERANKRNKEYWSNQKPLQKYTAHPMQNKDEEEYKYWKNKSDEASYNDLKRKADELAKMISWVKNPESKADKQKRLDEIHKKMEKYKR